MRRIAAVTGSFLAGFVLVGCATATIEDAVPAGALIQYPDPAEVPAAAVVHDAGITPAPAGVYPNLNVQPPTAAPQISEQKKVADRAELRARQTHLAEEGRRLGVSQDPAILGARARDRFPVQ